MNPSIIIQARTGSKRLPGKVLMEVAGRPLLEYVIRRCLLSQKTSKVIVATSILPGDDAVANLAASVGASVYRGSETDVLLRYVEAARQNGLSALVRITADCPLVDPKIIDDVIRSYQEKPADYVFIRDYPDGLGAAELLTLAALERALAETSPDQIYYREHVIHYLCEHPEKFSLSIQEAPRNAQKPAIHLSVDEGTDLEIVRRIAEYFSPRMDFCTDEILRFLDAHPDLKALSQRRAKRSGNSP